MMILPSSLQTTNKRLQMSICVARRQPCVFSQEEWLTAPYLQTAPSTADKLLNLLIQIPGLLARLDTVNSSPNNQFLEGEKVAIETETHTFLIELDHHWDSIISESNGTDPHTLLIQEPTNSSSPIDSTIPIAVSHFRCAKTLCLYILTCFYPRYEQDLTSFCSESLDLAEMLQAAEEINPSWPRMVSLLQIIIFSTPFHADERRACGILEGWAKTTGFLGIAMNGKIGAVGW